MAGLLVIGSAWAEPFSSNQLEFEQRLAAPEFKGSDPCAESKGVCIQDDFQPSTSTMVEFDFNSALIRPAYFPVLNELGRALTQGLSREVLNIVGHTDSIGAVKFHQNMQASSILDTRWSSTILDT